MRKSEFATLAHEIQAFTGICTKLIAQETEEQLAQYRPGMSLPQYFVLRTLEHHPSTIKELSNRMMLAPSTLVPVIDKLEGEGLVLRGRDLEDRRRTPLELTTEAHHLLDNVPDVHTQDRLFNALQAMGPQKSRELSKLLQELVNELDPSHKMVEHVLSSSARMAARCEARLSAAKPELPAAKPERPRHVTPPGNHGRTDPLP
jgi:DNA-binding MarR family transcriptional regulator